MYQESLVRDESGYPLINPIHNRMRYVLGGSVIIQTPAPEEECGEWVQDPDEGAEITELPLGSTFRFGLGVLPGDIPRPGPGVLFNRWDITRWKRILSAIERKGPIRTQRYLPSGSRIRYRGEHYHEAFTRGTYLGNMSGPLGSSQRDPEDHYMQILFSVVEEKVLLILLLALPAAYGGIHLAAVNSNFLSHVERHLWKVSSIYVMVALAFLIACSAIIRPIAGKLHWALPSRVPRARLTGPLIYLPWYGNVFQFILHWLGYLIFLGYILARIFLVVESFVSLGAEPIGAFWSPAWLQMIPHM